MALTLPQGLQQLGLVLPDAAQEKLAAYLALVRKWNKVYNLTALRDEERMLTHHLLDSLAVVPHVGEARTLLDVGSGAGFPGIPLALALPELKVTLLDSNHKKTTFMRQAKMQLALANVEVACERVEQHARHHAYDIVISRAFAELHEFAGLAGRLAAPGGRLIAMKGVHAAAELGRLSPKAGSV